MSTSLRLAYVTDVLDDAKSGAVITAQRFLAALRPYMNIQVITTQTGGPNITVLPSIEIPFAQRLMKANGMRFGRPIPALMEPVIAASDVVYVHLPFWLSHEAVRIAQRMKKPIVAGYHILPHHLVNFWSRPPNWLLQSLHHWMIRNIYRHAHAIVAPSHFARHQLLRDGNSYGHLNVHVISNGIPKQFSPAPQSSTSPPSPSMHIVCIGRFSREKNQSTLIRAIQQARHRHQMKLHLVGAGPMESTLQQLAAQLDVPVTIGYIPNEQLTQLLQSADVVVHAATLETEGMSLLEAMGCGAPVLVANSPLSSTPELIGYEPTYLFDPYDVQGLADKLDQWYEQPQLRQQARQFVLERAPHYAFDRCVERFAQLVQTTAASNKPKQAIRYPP